MLFIFPRCTSHIRNRKKQVFDVRRWSRKAYWGLMWRPANYTACAQISRSIYASLSTASSPFSKRCTVHVSTLNLTDHMQLLAEGVACPSLQTLTTSTQLTYVCTQPRGHLIRRSWYFIKGLNRQAMMLDRQQIASFPVSVVLWFLTLKNWKGWSSLCRSLVSVNLDHHHTDHYRRRKRQRLHRRYTDSSILVHQWWMTQHGKWKYLPLPWAKGFLRHH